MIIVKKAAPKGRLFNKLKTTSAILAKCAKAH